MKAFVESNFVLELVLKQDESDAASKILEMAEKGDIELAIPAYSLVEPYHTLARDSKERRALLEALERPVKQMARSANFADVQTQSRALFFALANKADIDMRELGITIDRIVRSATVLPLTSERIGEALARLLFDLTLPDAIVFASIRASLVIDSQAESIFANRDRKGFLQPTVKDDLQNLKCRVIPTFKDALAYLEKRLT